MVADTGSLRIDLTGLTIPVDEVRRVDLKGSYNADELSQVFVEEWIPYLECHKCGRSDYCKFAQPDPYGRPGRFAEIRCGVAETVIRNYVSGVFSLLVDRPAEELQAWLDGSYHFVQFVYGTEIHIGRMLDKDHLDWWGTDEYRASFFGWTAQLRKALDRFAALMRHIPDFRTTSSIILTEGPSEKAFLQRLKQTGLLWFLHRDIESYYGSGNRQPTKLLALATRLRDQGYQLFIQGDRDGTDRDIFQQLIKQGIVDEDNTFSFQADFESAFSAEHIHAALSKMSVIGAVEIDAFRTKISSRPVGSSVVKVIQDEFGIQVDKIELAEALADVLEEMWVWTTDEDFWSSEIGTFLDKIRRLPI